MKKNYIITLIIFLSLVMFALGMFVGYNLANHKAKGVESYNVMYATVIAGHRGTEDLYLLYITQIKEDDPKYWFEENRYSIYTDKNTSVIWRGQKILPDKLQPGDFIKVTFQGNSEFLESYPVSVHPSVVEIEYLGRNNYLQ